MELIKDKTFGGERPLFATHDLRLENVTIFSKNPQIGTGVFDDCPNVVIHCYDGSTVKTYCEENNIRYELIVDEPEEFIY